MRSSSLLVLGLALPAGLAVEDEFVCSRLEPVDGGLREERVGYESVPFDRLRFDVTIVAATRCRSNNELVDVGVVEASS